MLRPWSAELLVWTAATLGGAAMGPVGAITRRRHVGGDSLSDRGRPGSDPPALHADGGDVELVEFDEEGFVCLTCRAPAADARCPPPPTALGIEAELRRC